MLFGTVNWLEDMTNASAFVIFAFIAITMWFAPKLGHKAESNYDKQSPQDQRKTQLIFLAGVAPVMLIAPIFMGTYITNVFNLIALYTIMGIGLNVMVGYAGLLDLGYVASFAIGAYTLGIVTAPNVLTCGGVHPKDIPFQDIPTMCKGIEIFFITLPRSFWFAWPICVAVSAFTGMMLGVPVLRLRGDYLAIVTLGFGEIINRLILSNDFLQMEGRPLLGSAQGIAPIPSPSLNLSVLNSNWVTKLSSSTSIYYLFLVGVLIAGFVVYRLIHTRTGRAWRAIRSDEDVAQAMGIHLVNNKLLAFGISSAFAGLGGAVFGASLQGIFPNSFTILVSINVLSLIIIGGMGSISGVILGAFILIGMPELLRELDAYRLLSFGALLVAVMLVKPEGLLPPSPPRLTEKRDEQQSTKETVSHA
jgi:branched-chain amino acid transport system permease protein